MRLQGCRHPSHTHTGWACVQYLQQNDCNQTEAEQPKTTSECSSMHLLAYRYTNNDASTVADSSGPELADVTHRRPTSVGATSPWQGRWEIDEDRKQKPSNERIDLAEKMARGGE